MPRRTPRSLVFTAPRIAELIAFVAALVAFYGSMRGDFVWDDRILILEGQLPRAWQRLGEILTRDFFARSDIDVVYGYYRPLTTLSYLFDYSLWKLDPWGYHLTNVLLHAGCAALVVNLLRNFGWPPVAALLAGVLFAVHPIHSESVAWIAGRTDVIAFFFSALSLRLALGRSRRAAGLAAISFGCALLAKETAVITIPWLLIIDRFLRRQSWSQAILRVTPEVAVLVVYLVWRFGIIHVRGPAVASLQTPFYVALSLAPTLVRYLGWLTLPIEQNAYVINPYVTSMTDPRFAVAWLVLIGLGIVLATWIRRSSRRTLALAGVFLLAVAMLPNLNLVRPSSPANMGATMAERFCYYPSFPFVALLALAIDSFLVRSGRQLRWITATAVAAAIIGACAVTATRNRVWADELTFVQSTLAKSPQAGLLWGRLAEYQLQRRDLESAAEAIRRAEEIEPGSEGVLWARAYLRLLQGDVDEAIRLQEQLVARVRFAAAPARNNLAYLYRTRGRLDEAATILEQLIRDNHGYSDVYANLAEVYRARGDHTQARFYYEQALRDRPDDLQVGGALVSLEVADGYPQAAEKIYRDLLRYHPGEIRIQNNIAMIRAGAGDLAGALELLHELVRSHPNYASARVNLAQVLYRNGDRAGAIAQLEMARHLVSGTDLQKVVEEQLSTWKAERP